MTDSIQASAQEKYLSTRWVDLLETRHESSKTGDEIALEVIARCKLRLKGGE
jgi:hypothetical protein